MMDNLNYLLVNGPSEIVLRQCPSESVDLVLASPPYDMMFDYKGHTFNMQTFRKIARELKRVIKPGGAIVWIVGDQTKNGSETLSSARQAIYFHDNLGLNVHDTMVYQKNGPPLSHRRYEQAWEYMYVFTKGSPKTFNGIRVPKSHPEKKARVKNWTKYADNTIKRGRIKIEDDTRLDYNVWKITMGHVAEEKYCHEHPAIFPEELAHRHIYSWSNAGDVVLDPFCGTGTSGKMALNMGRKFIGIEISKDYMELAKRRLADNRAKRSHHNVSQNQTQKV